jgi:hypothetical protein
MRRVETSLLIDRPSPSLERIYQLGLWLAIFFAIFHRLPPNKFLRFRRTFHQFRSGWLCYFCYSSRALVVTVQVVACAASFYAHVFFDKEYHVEGSRLQRFAWFRRKQELHFVHHRHANSNFAVIHFFWDRILGTYRRPDAGQTQTNGTLRIGGPDGCSAIRNGRRCLSSPITLRHGSSHPRAYRLRDHDRCHLSDTVRTNHQTASPRPLQSVRRCDCE